MMVMVITSSTSFLLPFNKLSSSATIIIGLTIIDIFIFYGVIVIIIIIVVIIMRLII